MQPSPRTHASQQPSGSVAADSAELGRRRTSPDVEWREAQSNPHQPSGEAWIGPQGVIETLFTKLAEDWEDFTITPTAFHDAGNSVIVEGQYTGKHKETTNQLDGQFCPVWRMRGEQAAGFQQYVDTAQLRDAVNG